MIRDEEASDNLNAVLDEARTPHGTVDNVMRVHSLRPATMQGHVALYKAALHNDENTLPTWLQETLSSYVSILNDCPYSLANHWANAKHLIGDNQKSDAIEKALRSDVLEPVFDGMELALLHYTKKLTCTPQDMVESDVQALRTHGLDDGQILEANQIVAYFNYANRLLNGLGVSTDGDVVGYYASEP
jgi:uncharacterized peroxidase-related enzyme